MDIRDTDLQYLPYKLVKWQCIFPGCKCGTKVRDYGIPGYYYWPVKVRYYKDGWRGGWIFNDHAYLCSKHWKPVIKRQIPFPDHSPEICAKKFITLK